MGTITAPAAGAPTVQILIATLLAGGVSAALGLLVVRHRDGRTRLLAHAAALASKVLSMEPWAALPIALAGGGLLVGGFGVFWDISLHIGRGRDPGPLANPSHYLILACLYSCFAAGLLAIVLHRDAKHPSPRPLRLPLLGEAPVGGALLFGCGAFALSGFPLDVFWHRMFGQDVTLWGPTHLVMINGAILSVPCLTVLGLESRRARNPRASLAPRSGFTAKAVGFALAAALLFAISFWATEFDWGIPQYRMVWQPLLLAAAAGIALTAGRVSLGRGGAIGAVALYLLARGATHLGVDILGETAPAMPLFVVEGVLVELVFARGTRLGVLWGGVVAGLLCGTAGFAAEYAWSNLVMPLPWTPALLPEGIPTALIAGTAGGTLGALLGGALRGQLLAPAVRRRAGALAGVALIAVGANALWTSQPAPIRAHVALSGPANAKTVTARFDPPAAVRHANWLTVTDWQGGGLHVRRMHQIAPGLWRAAGPVPMSGKWKTVLRLQKGRALVSVPLHLPADTAVPFKGVLRPAHFSATFAPDVKNMQTERRDFVPGWLWTPAALLMLAFCMIFVLAISAGIVRAVDPGEGRSGSQRGVEQLRRVWARRKNPEARVPLSPTA